MIADAFFRGLERRAVVLDPKHPKDPGVAALFGSRAESNAGVMVSDEVALTYSAVFACVKVLAETLASVPLHVFERQDGGKDRAPDHPLYRVLHTQPNPYMSSAEWREAMMLSVGLRGNGVSTLEFDSRGNVSTLWPVRGDRVRPLVRDRRLYYAVDRDDQSTRYYESTEVMHVRGMGWGLWGLSPIDYAREAIGLGLASEKFGAKFYANGTAISGLLFSKKPLSPEARERLSKAWKASRSGLDNAHSVPVLEDEMDYKSMGVEPEAAQFLETRKHQIAEVASWYRVPLHLINQLERSTNNNIEHQSLEFVKFTMLPWFFKWEQAIDRDLFGPIEGRRYFAEFQLQGLERGDMKSRVEYYTGMTNAGAISPNEIRGFENLNPRDGGDVYLEPMNMRPGGNPAPSQQPTAASARRRMLPIAGDAARRIARGAKRELDKLARKHLQDGDVDAAAFASEVRDLWSAQERRAAEILAPLAAACGVDQDGARRGAAVWCEWSGLALAEVRDAEGLARVTERWMAASDAAGAAMLASLEEAA
jgi:HK97 family phage portal protein